MFSQPLYEDKEDVKPEKKEPQTEQERLQAEREEEAEYLETISNFHWLVYPFFKTIETMCDKVFGCKRKALKINEEVWNRRETEQKKREEEWEKEKQQMKKYE